MQAEVAEVVPAAAALFAAPADIEALMVEEVRGEPVVLKAVEVFTGGRVLLEDPVITEGHTADQCTMEGG